MPPMPMPMGVPGFGWPYPSPPVSPNMLLPGQVTQLMLYNLMCGIGIGDIIAHFQNENIIVENVSLPPLYPANPPIPGGLHPDGHPAAVRRGHGHRPLAYPFGPRSDGRPPVPEQDTDGPDPVCPDHDAHGPPSPASLHSHPIVLKGPPPPPAPSLY